MLIGLIAGILTGALWGLTFVAPRAVQPFTEVDLAIARYCVFGIVSLLLMALPRFRPRAITARRFGLAVFLGGVGYVGYYLFAAFAVRLAGPAIPPLVIGALPVALAIIGNWQDGTVRWRALIVPLGLILVGLTVVNVATLSQAATPAAQGDVLLGTVCALGAFAIWIAYGVLNARAMRGDDAPDALVWTGLQGVGALLCTLPLIPMSAFAGWSALPHVALASAEGVRFIIWAVTLGIAGSWLATWFWVIASARLPLALSAQLIVSETIFALLYGFLYEGRMPLPAEGLGSALLIAGVFMGVNIFRRVA